MDPSPIKSNQSEERGLDVSHENNELKVLILKLNQDKTMYEKKVQRRNQEINRLKQLLQEKEEQIARANPGYGLQNLSKSHIETTSKDDARNKIEYIEQLLQPFKHLQEDGKPFNVERIIQKMIDLLQEKPSKDEKTTQLEREVSKLQEQIRIDTNYHNKRIHLVEESFFRQKKDLQAQIQAQSNQLQIQQAKLQHMMSKILDYEKQLMEINSNAIQNELVKTQILQQLKQNAQLKKGNQPPSIEVDLSKSVGSQPQRIPTADVNLIDIDQIVQNVQKNTSQRLLRKS